MKTTVELKKNLVSPISPKTSNSSAKKTLNYLPRAEVHKQPSFLHSRDQDKELTRMPADRVRFKIYII